MSFINTEDHGITFSKTVYDIGSECPVLGREDGGRILTTDGLELEQDCIPDRYACYGLCTRLESTNYFSITNTCSSTFTLTGFEVADPEYFSLFEDSFDRIDIYNQESAPEIFPIRLKPNESIQVPTFFVPPPWVLEYGKKGTFEDRSGDKFSTEVKIFPGFPGDGANELDCDTKLILSGELICEPKKTEDYDFLHNTDNWEPPQYGLKPFTHEVFRNTYKLKTTPLYSSNTKLPVHELIKNYADYMDDLNWFKDVTSNWAITGCIDLMYYYFKDKPALTNGTLSKKFNLTSVNHISESFFNKTEDVINQYVYNEVEYVGYKVDTVADDLPFGYVRDVLMFISVPVNNKSNKIFICEVPPGNADFFDFDLEPY